MVLIIASVVVVLFFTDVIRTGRRIEQQGGMEKKYAILVNSFLNTSCSRLGEKKSKSTLTIVGETGLFHHVVILSQINKKLIVKWIAYNTWGKFPLELSFHEEDDQLEIARHLGLEMGDYLAVITDKHLGTSDAQFDEVSKQIEKRSYDSRVKTDELDENRGKEGDSETQKQEGDFASKLLELNVDEINELSSILKEEYPQIEAEDIAKQRLSDKLEEHNVNYLYHMTHIDNLRSILKYGLLSHNSARGGKLETDIADNEVNERRSKPDPIYDRSLHDYVPLYFNPKNPMLYSRKGIQNDIVILAINTKIIGGTEVVFTDGNAASSGTKFYSSVTDLQNLNMACIYGEYWNDFEDGKRERCAETLVPNRIGASMILKVFCNGTLSMRQVEEVTAQFDNVSVEINPILFF